MGRNQWILISGALLLLGTLYFGFDIIPPKQKEIEKSRLNNLESTSVSNLIKAAEAKLNNTQKSVIDALNLDIQNNAKDTAKVIEYTKRLSGAWYEMGHHSIAGSYAEDVAKIEKSENAWSIAGTTYALCVKQAIDDKEKEFCSKRSIKAIETAISINPENVENRINLAICYVDLPSKDNPMQGILMLRELNTKYPENVSVLNQLGKLALQTNQVDKALERLENAIKIEPKNKSTICLLADAYTQKGNAQKAKMYSDQCKD
jgi:tetratricopeptide (TPR) repeat protein